jgi:class 3 adenylate cyclase
LITGARIAAQAEPNEILVSATVRDLVAGSGIEFEDGGAN